MKRGEPGQCLIKITEMFCKPEKFCYNPAMGIFIKSNSTKDDKTKKLLIIDGSSLSQEERKMIKEELG